MSEPKTRPIGEDVLEFSGRVQDEGRRDDSPVIMKLMCDATGATPKMWERSIVGLGRYHYRHASGMEGVWPVIGFSLRKIDLTLYVMPGVELYPELMAKPEKYKTGKSCLYIKKLKNVDGVTLKELILKSVKAMD